MEFRSAYAHGFARVAACTLPIKLAEPAANAESLLAQARACDADAVALAVFPELCLTGYSLEDLFLQDPVLDAAEDALHHFVAQTRDLLPVIVIGAPLRNGN
ncbi:MAG: nitrilase-related carbon-nitrogen hydrolase, partial [Dermatophilaceae bacterium]